MCVCVYVCVYEASRGYVKPLYKGRVFHRSLRLVFMRLAYYLIGVMEICNRHLQYYLIGIMETCNWPIYLLHECCPKSSTGFCIDPKLLDLLFSLTCIKNV